MWEDQILRIARVPYMNISGLSVMAFVAPSYDRDNFQRPEPLKIESDPDPVLQKSGTGTGIKTRYGVSKVRSRRRATGRGPDRGTVGRPTEAGHNSFNSKLGKTSVRNQPWPGIEGVAMPSLAFQSRIQELSGPRA